MSFERANRANLLRCSQKDEQLIELYASNLSEIFRLIEHKYHISLIKVVNPLSQFFYYVLTSLSKLQTIGEEYTGILRVNNKTNIPKTLDHLLWLLFYIGGETALEKGLTHCERYFIKNTSLQPQARNFLIKWIRFIKCNKEFFIRCHQAYFYINGQYYNISNRFTGINYVFLRNWLKGSQSETAFNSLGQISMFYLISTLAFKFYQQLSVTSSIQNREHLKSSSLSTTDNDDNDICFICADSKINPSALPCGHVFCWNCICDIIQHESKCPICRETIQQNEIIMLQNF